jgi:diaminobutyrate-2-oxoglutarate transaminase
VIAKSQIVDPPEFSAVADPFDLESEVRSYSRCWPVMFSRSTGSTLYATDGRAYLDFFAGAGALNYGHNNPLLKAPLLEYLASDGVIHSLDMMTVAKASFLRAFHDLVLVPRKLDYKIQFTGPTGTNAVEAALKLARKVTGRQTIAAFTRSFHGMSLGALAVTGNAAKRAAAGVALGHVLRLPFEGFGAHGLSGLELLDDLVGDTSSGIDLPAAVIVETVQAEGGINVASGPWLQQLAGLCREREMLLVVDDIQVGCGRTGRFFSFEEAGLCPDIVCLSKSLSGYGFPMAVTLFRRDLDVWRPGEHNGTFRGSNHAFITATAAIEAYWSNRALQDQTEGKGKMLSHRLAGLSREYADHGASYRGRGLIWGLEFSDPSIASRICRAAFHRGLLMETAGPRDEVVKLIPPLTVTAEELQDGLDILAAAAREVLR